VGPLIAAARTCYMPLTRWRSPHDILANMMRPPRPVQFAEGGPVGTPQVMTTARGAVVGGNTFNLNASAADILTERNILNWIVPILNRLEKRAGR